MMCVVCDSGPLTHLWQIDLWSAFSAFNTIHLADQVVREVRHHVALERLEKLTGCTLKIHIISQNQIESVKKQVSPLILEPADLATLSLAQKLRPDFVLTDDLTLRRALDAKKQNPMGSVGLLLHACKVGLLNREALDQSIDHLFVHSTLYLSPQFKSYVRKLISDKISEKAPFPNY